MVWMVQCRRSVVVAALLSLLVAGISPFATFGSIPELPSSRMAQLLAVAHGTGGSAIVVDPYAKFSNVRNSERLGTILGAGSAWDLAIRSDFVDTLAYHTIPDVTGLPWLGRAPPSLSQFQSY